MAEVMAAWKGRNAQEIVLFFYVSNREMVDRVRNNGAIPNVSIPSDAFPHRVDPTYLQLIGEVESLPNIVLTAATPDEGRAAVAQAIGRSPEDINYALQIRVTRESLGRIVPYGTRSFQAVTSGDVPVTVDRIVDMTKMERARQSVDGLVTGSRVKGFYVPPKAAAPPAYQLSR